MGRIRAFLLLFFTVMAVVFFVTDQQALKGIPKYTNMTEKEFEVQIDDWNLAEQSACENAGGKWMKELSDLTGRCSIPYPRSDHPDFVWPIPNPEYMEKTRENFLSVIFGIASVFVVFAVLLEWSINSERNGKKEKEPEYEEVEFKTIK